MNYLKLFDSYEKRMKYTLMTQDDIDKIEDILLEYIDKYYMIKMPLVSEDNPRSQAFDLKIKNTQYFIKLLNPPESYSCEIQISSINPLDNISKDIKENFLRRVNKFGYRIGRCSETKSITFKYTIYNLNIQIRTLPPWICTI